jgi:long-chain acyl-CoA synthetase
MEHQYKSLHEFFLNSMNQLHSPEYPFLHKKTDGVYNPITYQKTKEYIDALSALFTSFGWERGDRVAIIHENSPEFIYFDQALMKLGLVNVSIYPTLTAEETAYILNDSGSKGLLLGSKFLLKKFEKVKAQCPGVEKVILNFYFETEGNNYLLFADAIEKGEKLYGDYSQKIESRFQSVGHDDLATLIYTSGTTGVSKGVMLTHYNFMSNAYDAIALCPAIDKTDKFLSFLPLSHVYERMVSYVLATYIGAQIAFSEGLEKISQNFGEAQPTIIATVPRLLEKVESKIRRKSTEAGGIKLKIFNWSQRIGKQFRLAKESNQNPGLWLTIQYGLAEKLVYSKIKKVLGGKIKLIVSGGGALPGYVGEFFGNMGIRIQEGYGLTETSPFVSVNEFHRQLFGTVGRIAPSQQVAIQNIETKELITVQSYDSFNPEFACDEGEILVKGPNVMKGYWNKPEDTAEVIDEQGWFHTGDIGKFDRGYLKITDRLKNMLKTSLGKNIYPTPIENIYLQSPKIEQLFIIGDKREFVTAIIVPSVEEMKSTFGVTDAYFEDSNPMIDDEKIKQWLDEDIRLYSQKLAKFERIKDFVIKRNAFTMETNELTVTQKQKRKVIESNYSEFIEKMYTDEQQSLNLQT